MNPPSSLLYNADRTETLGYVCAATVQRHNAKGVLYRHRCRWSAGFQELVFASHEAAAKWINSSNP